MDVPVNGVSVFRVHRLIWFFLEPDRAKSYRALSYICSALIVILVVFGFPAHLFIGLVQSETQNDVLANLAVTVPVAVTSLKSLCIWWKLQKVHKIDEILKRLDQRISEVDEVMYYQSEVMTAAKRMVLLFYCICIGGVAFMQIGVIITGVFSEWRLMYQGYFPFEEYGSTLSFGVANFYQFIGLVGVTYQAVANDTYAPIGLIMIAGHVHMLRMRVTKIGTNPEKSVSENNAELVNSIKTHKDLLELNHMFHEIISFYMVVQIIIAGLNMCVLLINVIYSMDELFVIMYYLFAWFAMLMETFPSCYYGSYLEAEFDELTQSIFSCNWVDQNKEFKKNFAIFMEQSLKKITSKAGGGMIHINLNSFVAACKGAYSLFAFLMQTK